MLQRFRTSILKSEHLFTYINDARRIVFLYVMILIAFMMLPFVIIERTQGVISRLEKLEWMTLFEENQIFDDITFGPLGAVISKDFSIQSNFIQVSNSVSFNPSVIQVIFYDTYISLVLGGESFQDITYELLMTDSLKSYDDLMSNPQSIVSPLLNYVNRSPIIISVYYVSLGLSIAIEYLVLTLVFTFIFGMNQKHAYPFGKRYKIGLYLSTIYVVSQVLLMLFQLYMIGALSFLLTYIMYYRAYKKRIIHE